MEEERSTVVINLFGGPASGKSTLAADLFARLKKHHIVCELVLEYAKENIYEDRFRTLENQVYVFGKQHHRIWRVIGKVDVVITDSPFLLSAIYDVDQKEKLKDLVVSEFDRLNTINFFLKRNGNIYDPKGRIQSYEEALEKDLEIKAILDENRFDYELVDWGDERGEVLEGIILDKLRKNTELYDLDELI